LKVKAGDFIAYDRTSDGSFDHIGDVTKRGSAKKITKWGYRNFKVAQHTRDYHEWVSSSDNGWENILSNYPKATLGIIRIG
jgi:hypothetical protein